MEILIISSLFVTCFGQLTGVKTPPPEQWTSVCNNPWYNGAGESIPLSKSNEILKINYGDHMIFTFDITFNSAITDGLYSVFQCGSTNLIRMPGIWVRPDSFIPGKPKRGFTISFSNVDNSNDYRYVGAAFVVGQIYSLYIEITQFSYEIKINGQTLYSNFNYPQHELLLNVPCYAGSPWFDAADAIITNLKIFEVGDCWSGESSSMEVFDDDISYFTQYFSFDIKDIILIISLIINIIAINVCCLYFYNKNKTNATISVKTDTYESN